MIFEFLKKVRVWYHKKAPPKRCFLAGLPAAIAALPRSIEHHRSLIELARERSLFHLLSGDRIRPFSAPNIEMSVL